MYFAIGIWGGGRPMSLLLRIMTCHKPRLHGDSDPDPDPDWLHLHGGKLDSNPDSDHFSHVVYDPDSNPDSGPGARVNAAIDKLQLAFHQ